MGKLANYNICLLTGQSTELLAALQCDCVYVYISHVTLISAEV